jgi:hypothetical protein
MSTTRYATCGEVTILAVAGNVGGHMSFQQVLSAKTFGTDGTNEWALSRVASDMPDEVIGASKFSFAESADIQARGSDSSDCHQEVCYDKEQKRRPWEQILVVDRKMEVPVWLFHLRQTQLLNPAGFSAAPHRSLIFCPGQEPFRHSNLGAPPSLSQSSYHHVQYEMLLCGASYLEASLDGQSPIRNEFLVSLQYVSDNEAVTTRGHIRISCRPKAVGRHTVVPLMSVRDGNVTAR